MSISLAFSSLILLMYLLAERPVIVFTFRCRLERLILISLESSLTPKSGLERWLLTISERLLIKFSCEALWGAMSMGLQLLQQTHT